MTNKHLSNHSLHKISSWNVAKFLLIGLALLIVLDVAVFLVQRGEMRQELEEYYEGSTYYRKYRHEMEEEINDQLPKYELSRILMIFVNQLPYTILMVYCFFFHNKYAGKFIYLLTTALFAWVYSIIAIALLIGADTPLSHTEGFAPVVYQLLVILLCLGLAGTMLALFLCKIILPTDKMKAIAEKLPFVLAGIQILMVIFSLIQIEEFTASVALSIVNQLVNLLFFYALHLLWQSESDYATAIIHRNHGAADLKQDLQTLSHQLNTGALSPNAYEQQKNAILKSFAHIATPAAYHATLQPAPAAAPASAPVTQPSRPVQAAPIPAEKTPAVPAAKAAAPSPVEKVPSAPAAPAPTTTAAEKPAEAEKVPTAPAPAKAPAWVCQFCGTRNPAAQQTCYNCKARKPSAAPASASAPAQGTWTCTTCGAKNPSNLSICANCHERKAHSSGWKCKNCGTENPAHRGSCAQCGNYR